MRLIDKENKIEDISFLSESLDEALAKMLTKPQNGGYPLLYFFLASKKHEIIHCNCPKPENIDLNLANQKELVEKLNSLSCDDDCNDNCICKKLPDNLSEKDKIKRQDKILNKLKRFIDHNCHCLTTAATDGKKFMWNASFMREMISIGKLQIIMMHEVLHLIGHHYKRMFPMTPLKNIVVDLFVNGMIQKELGHVWWSDVVNFEVVKKMVSGEIKLDPEKKVMYVDVDILTRTPEDVYDELKKLQNIPNDIIELMSMLGIGDNHIPEEISLNELRKQLLNALAASASMKNRGHSAGGIEEMIEALIRPRIKAADIVKNYAMIHANKNGNENNYKVYRRRYMGMDKPLYLPTTKGRFANILVCLDSSGSVSNESLSRFLGDLHGIVNNANLLVVPNDSVPYWEKAVFVRNTNDIIKMRVVGRGGTVLSPFFQECHAKVPHFKFNMILVLTDGYIDDIDQKLNPGVDVVWVVINNRGFKSSFGRVIHIID